jgi:3'-5' exoribonuclease
MKSPYVSELQPNQIVTGTFIVQHKDVRQKKTGEPWLSMILGDRTGEIEARMWDNVADVVDTFERDDFLRVRGLLQVFQNRVQLTIHRLQRQPEDSVDLTDYFPASSRNPDEMFAEVRQVIDSIRNEHLNALLRAVFDDAEIARRFRIAPAAKNVHHAYLGGLMEHVLSMCGLARLTASHYRDIDLDLLLTGVLLHDFGKIFELTYDRTFGYSSEGQLLGHIYIGLRLLGEKLRGIPEFPVRLRALLEHMILSHHGELEYGSPKMPQFPEALLLHHLDNLDSKMECMRACLEKDKQVDGCWTSYNQSLERSMLKKQKYLEEREAAPVPAVPVPVRAAPAAPPSPAPAPVVSLPRPPAQSPFAEKLKSALGREPV